MSDLRQYHDSQKRRSMQFTITLPPHLANYVEEQAREHQVPKSTVVAFALHKHKESRMMNAPQGGQPRVSMEEVGWP